MLYKNNTERDHLISRILNQKQYNLTQFLLNNSKILSRFNNYSDCNLLIALQPTWDSNSKYYPNGSINLENNYVLRIIPDVYSNTRFHKKQCEHTQRNPINKYSELQTL